jgi:hypothetical protein
MADKVPFTIEILGVENDHPVVVDRVIGGSMDFEEAKRIGEHLLSIADEGSRPKGYRILCNGRALFIYNCGDRGGDLH